MYVCLWRSVELCLCLFRAAALNKSLSERFACFWALLKNWQPCKIENVDLDCYFSKARTRTISYIENLVLIS